MVDRMTTAKHDITVLYFGQLAAPGVCRATDQLQALKAETTGFILTLGSRGWD